MKETGLSCDKQELELFFKIMDERPVNELVADGKNKIFKKF